MALTLLGSVASTTLYHFTFLPLTLGLGKLLW